MNDTELREFLKTQHKFYAGGLVKQSRFSSVLIRHEAGLIKPKTWEKFLNDLKFVKINGLWEKQL
jgi:hypothetical protein